MPATIRPLSLVLALFAVALPAATARAQFGFDTLEPSDGAKIVRMELLTNDGTIAAGATEYVGVRLRIQPGWHVYWRNPGDSGTEPRVRIEAPLGVTVGSIAWPRPIVFEQPEETTYGYAGEVVLLVPVTAPADLPVGTLTLPVEAEWLVCKRACLMGDATGSVSLRVRPAGDNRVRVPGDALADAVRRLPTPIAKAAGVTAVVEPISTPEVATGRRLVVTGPAGDADRVRFIPDLTPGVKAGDGHPVDATIADGRFRIEVPMTVEPGNALDTPLEVAGLVLFGPLATDRAISFRIPVAE